MSIFKMTGNEELPLEL